MTRFNVPDMSCGHCTAAIESAIKNADAEAEISCSLEDRTIAVSAKLADSEIVSTLASIGYDASPA